MRALTSTSILGLAILAGCSSTPSQDKKVATEHKHPSRYVAQVNDMVTNHSKLKSRIDKLMTGIFHGYLIGQVQLQKYDAELDKNPEKAMKSDSYSTLLAVRSFVDQFEHDVNDLYMSLVPVSALPEYSPEQKLNAEIGLKSIGDFMNGLKTDRKSMPDNLKPLILSNLREKQTALYENLKDIHDGQSDDEVKKSIHKNMSLLRATRLSFYREILNYKVNKDVLAETLKEESKKKSFTELETEIKALSKDIKSFMTELGRTTSADEISPSTGLSGNLTGRTFPERTWSLTYDDGPGKSTTDTIVKNLVEKNIPATFFMLAKQVEAYPAVAMRIKEAGMDLASHSYTHAQMTKVGSVQLEREIGTSKKVIEEKLGAKVKLFRLPYGAGVSVAHIRQKIAEHKMIHVFWNVDTLDWQDKNPQSIYNRTLKQMKASAKNSGIILFHDIHPQSVIASTLLMDYFNKENLTICTVQGVVDQINKNLPSCK